MVKKKKKDKKVGKLKRTVADKLETAFIILFIFAIFLLDVNANMIGAYGSEVKVNLFEGKQISASSLFWLGFLASCICLFIMSTRSLYNKKRTRKRGDLIFTILGIIGLMIILSGGLLIFFQNSLLEIPIFSWKLARVTYYHIGIALEVAVALYFSLIKG